MFYFHLLTVFIIWTIVDIVLVAYSKTQDVSFSTVVNRAFYTIVIAINYGIFTHIDNVNGGM